MQDLLGELCKTTVAGFAKRLNQQGDRSALDCGGIAGDSNTAFVQCPEKFGSKCWLFELLASISWYADGPAGERIWIILLNRLCLMMYSLLTVKNIGHEPVPSTFRRTKIVG